MNVLERTFALLRREKRCGFVPFIVAGDPDLETTAQLIVTLANAGATAIEIGVPFSDPAADGPVIQRAAQRSLSRGTTVRSVLAMIKRTRVTAPLILFSYYNPILQLGLKRFVQMVRSCGVSGVLVTDLPAEAAGPLRTALRARGIDLIFLIAPTTSDVRLRQISKEASGFLYAIARTGVTGTARGLQDESRALVRRIRRASDLPVAVGFGIASPEQARAICRYADAAVIGSRLVAEIEAAASEEAWERGALVARIGRFAQPFAGGSAAIPRLGKNRWRSSASE